LLALWATVSTSVIVLNKLAGVHLVVMQKLQLSPERVHLLQKVAKKDKDPLEILFCTIVAVLLFIYVYLLVESKFRHEEWLLAMLLGPGVVFLLCVGFSFIAYKKLKFSVQGDRRNLCVNLAICAWCGLIAGFCLGERSYWQYTTNIYSYRDLVSYVDVSPSKDNGQSYMDSGHVYFHEHSYVLRQKFNKFRNGDTYCVAPIVAGRFTAQPGTNANTMNGFVLPESGTYDWWAVGTNCCDGTEAANFTCGSVNNPLARSGMRLLSDTQRPYYLLAVQEWSATYGLPVKHPLFFTWVKDPLETEDEFDQAADQHLWMYMWYVLLGAFIVSFLLHMVMHRNKIY
jgi:hypothetical protein